MTLKGLLPLALLTLALGCQFERLQQVRVAQEMKALEQVMAKGQPLPPLPADPARFGPYWPLLEHMHTQATRLQAASQKVESLSQGDRVGLAPDRLVEAAHRLKEHERLGALVQNLEVALDAEDELVGAKGQAFVQGLAIDGAFKRGIVNGFQGQGKTLDLLLSIMRQKRDYYRMMEGIVTLADQGLEGRDPAGKLRFRTQEQVTAYSNAIAEFKQAEARLNEDVVRFQAQRKVGVNSSGS
jgi:hypothetical protein